MTKKYKANKPQVIRKLYDLGHDEKEIQTMTDYSKPLIGVVLRNYKAPMSNGLRLPIPSTAHLTTQTAASRPSTSSKPRI